MQRKSSIPKGNTLEIKHFRRGPNFIKCSRVVFYKQLEDPDDTIRSTKDLMAAAALATPITEDSFKNQIALA